MAHAAQRDELLCHVSDRSSVVVKIHVFLDAVLLADQPLLNFAGRPSLLRLEYANLEVDND